MNVRGRKVLLRAIERSDLEQLHRWGNDPEIWMQLGGWHFPTSMRDTIAWWESLRPDSTQQRFAIEAPELGLIGTANLVDIDWKNNHAFHGMMIGNPDSRGRGLGVDTIMATMRYAFDELHFERLDGSMIAFNQRSVDVYCGKCGWKEEGRARNWYFRQGRYWDKLHVGVTRDDYRALIAQNHYWDE